MTLIYLDPERVKTIRKDKECSLQEARRLALLEAFDFAIVEAKTVDDLEGILKALVRLALK